jgi:hypothetical protein
MWSILCFLSFIPVQTAMYMQNDVHMKQHVDLHYFRGGVSQRMDDNSNNNNHQRLRLRFDYTNLERLSPVAKEIEARQSDCSVKKVGYYYHTNGSGLGSEIHIYSIVLCTALEMGDVRLHTAGSWIYNDVEKCPTTKEQSSAVTTPMSCYFPQAEPNCPMQDVEVTRKAIQTFDIAYQDRYTCPRITNEAGGHSNVRAATTEYLFTRVSDIVQQEGERQLNVLFGSIHQGRERGKGIYQTPKLVPKNLITVHIRWGDKDGEMKLVPIQNYTNAVQQILDKRKAQRDLWKHDKMNKMLVANNNAKNGDDIKNVDDEVHILLARKQ